MLKLADAKSWHVQLQGTVSVDTDLVIVDIDTEQDPRELAKRDGEDAIVLAYLSIGEAEDYRPYWAKLDKDLIIRENPDWKGNYTVKFWEDAWQLTIMSRLVEAQTKGFAGVYLDKCDAYDDVINIQGDAETGLTYRERMADFVKRLRTAVPDMVVMIQNAPELLTSQQVHELIDGVGVEDLVYGEETTGKRNSMHSTSWRSDVLRSTGLPVFVLEYLPNDEKVQAAKRVVLNLGWPLTVESEDRSLSGKTVIHFEKIAARR